MIKFIKKNFSNILFFGFILFLFTPFGLPVRALMIKGVSLVTTQVVNLEIDKNERVQLSTYNWNLTDLNGLNENFSQFEGKVIIVNFWATWCPPCIAEMPSFQKLYNDYKGKIEFVFVAQDDKEKVKKFMLSNNYDLPVYFEESGRPGEMGSNSLPTTYIIDTNGEIAVNKIGALDWNSQKVRNILDELIK